MGQSGSLVFYSTNDNLGASALLDRLPLILNDATIFVAGNELAPGRSFDRWKLVRSDPNSTYSGPEIELLARPYSVSSIARSYQSDRVLVLQAMGSRFGDRVAHACEHDIPESIRDRFVPSGLNLRLGWHDIFETAEHDEGRLFGRAFLSISFFSYGTPNDWKECRRMILENPEVQAVKRELEEIAGPLEQCVYWSV